MIRTATVLLAVTAALVPGCKGQEVVKPDPKTAEDLAACLRDKEEKAKLITMLQDENAKLQVRGAAGGEVVVKIEGASFEVKAGAPGDGPPPVDPKVAAAAAKEFVGVVERSRGAIQKCYEQALKKSAGLQSRPVKLTVMATFTTAGAYKGSSTAPSLGEPFDGCLRQVAQRWTLSQSSPAMTFHAPVMLTPS
jgi:hypothetical protein